MIKLVVGPCGKHIISTPTNLFKTERNI
jgi:hypothetical protein